MKLVLITALVLAAYAAVVLTHLDEVQQRPDVTSLRAGRYSMDLHLMRSSPTPLPSSAHDWSSPDLVPYVPVQFHINQRNYSRTVVETVDDSSAPSRLREGPRAVQNRPPRFSSLVAGLWNRSKVQPPLNGNRLIRTTSVNLEVNVEHVLKGSTSITVGYAYRTESWSPDHTASFIVAFRTVEYPRGTGEDDRPYTLRIDFTF